MVRTTCAVRECMSSSSMNKQLRFHQFPHSDERCQVWVEACSRPDLVERTCESLKNTYVCSLHFELHMYGKRSLKKTAIPTLLLPIKNSIHTQTQTDPEVKEENYVILRHHIVKPKASQNHQVLVIPSSQIVEDTDTIKYIGIDSNSQTLARLTETEMTPRKRKLRKQVSKLSKKLKLTHNKCEDVTERQFLKGCDKFLSPKLSAIVKAQIYLKPH